MAKINGLDAYSYAELLKLQERIEEAIAAKRVEDAASTKETLRAMAEKAGFNLNELFGKRGVKRGPSSVKYRNPKDTSQTWTGRGRKPNWLVDALKKGPKIDSFAI
jgi:DNA-binding protein H-NS